jgi:hypothetical protein
MGREMKRVPLDFNWPLKKTWGGYLNPFSAQSTRCPDCDGTGSSPEAKRMSDEWYGYAPFDPVAYGAKPIGVDHPAIVAQATRNVEQSPGYCGAGDAAIRREAIRLHGHWCGQWSHHLTQADVDALVADGRLQDFTRRPRTEEQARQLAEAGGYWMRELNGYTPTADEVNDWSMRGMAHRAINQHVCVKARMKREGLGDDTCARCGGDGTLWPTPEIEALHEAWERVEPPDGEGFQLWETTSEGSPSSPVFASMDALCAWCETNATTFGSHKTTAAEWRRMLDADFVCHREGNMVMM